MATLFISDLHLEDSRPDMTRQFVAFLQGPARQADELYILGDLFEAWIGDDALSGTATQVGKELAELSANGVRIHFQHGNRDFLLGEEFAHRAGMMLLAEEVILDLYGRPTVLLHGDSLCTDDHAYQAFRAQVRNPGFQAQFLAQSVDQRLAMARQARDASSKHTGQASMEIMDVNQVAVRACFQRHGVDQMIHGHTHRPATHEYSDPEARRIVLADWYRRGSYLEADRAGVRSISL